MYEDYPIDAQNPSIQMLEQPTQETEHQESTHQLYREQQYQQRGPSESRQDDKGSEQAARRIRDNAERKPGKIVRADKRSMGATTDMR